MPLTSASLLIEERTCPLQLQHQAEEECECCLVVEKMLRFRNRTSSRLAVEHRRDAVLWVKLRLYRRIYVSLAEEKG